MPVGVRMWIHLLKGDDGGWVDDIVTGYWKGQ